MNDKTMPEMLEMARLVQELDDGFREWSETIEKENQQQQDMVMVEFDTWEAFQESFTDPGSELLKLLTKAGLPPV